MTRIGKDIANLTPQQRAVLEMKLKQQRAKAAPQAPIGRRENQDVHPLSFSQQRLWFIDQLQPGESAYHISRALRLKGRLDIDALRRAFETIVSRHEVLRACFINDQGQPVQQIRPVEAFPLPVTDCTATDSQDALAAARRAVTEEIHEPFDLSTGPLLRAALMRLDGSDHVLAIVMHHVVSDGWSNGLLTRELSALYNAYAQGQTAPLEDLPLQYADFAAWQRDWLTGANIERLLDYWRGKLEGLSVLELPTDHPRPPMQSTRGASESHTFPRDLCDGLNDLCGRLGVTAFMVLLGAFKVLLMRYSRNADIAVAIPVAGRTRSELEDLIGLFTNTVIMRTALHGDPTFRELMRRLQEVSLGAYAHQDMPFDKLVDELRPERSLSHGPLASVMLAYQNIPARSLELHNLSWMPFEFEKRSARYDLLLFVSETSRGLVASMEYNIDLFDQSTIARMFRHLEVLLRGIVADPDRPLSRLPMLTTSEEEQLAAWNRTETEYPQDRAIHHLFEAQAKRTPDAVAARHHGETLSYRELDRRANQLANHLRKGGVGPDVLVGICAERSLKMIIGVLGILKAGGAYVPLDPAYPAERLAFILSDAKVDVLLTQASFVDRLPDHAAKTVLLDLDWQNIAHESVEKPACNVGADHLAYVIYTSGSTGQPKGVAICHRNTVTLVSWAQSVYSADDLRGVLFSTSICFDLSVFELFVTLSAGGCVIVVENALALRDTQGVTLINTVPSAMTELLREGDVPASVRAVNLAGEPLSATLADAVYEAGVCRVYDLYGPSEGTTYSTFALREKGGRETIGRPIANTFAYVLDEHRNPVPIGIPGELYVGGAGVARGYLDRPALTAERFVDDPFCGKPGAVMYKTGDQARFLGDGNLEFQGRLDFQVKIRGFRIELGEIECVLRSHATVQDCVVIAREDVPGDKRLVAYMVPEQGGTCDGRILRDYLREKLPDYMVPGQYVPMAALPQTPNGKVDRKSLPRPERVSSTPTDDEPQTAIEEMLCAIWSDVLGVESVGIHEDFFDLGGHSLLATKVISRVRSAFDIEIPLRALFETPTVAGLAGYIAGHRAEDRPAPLPDVERAAPAESYPLSLAQQRMWFVSQFNPEKPQYHLASAVRLRGRLDVTVLERSIEEIVRRHEVLRAYFPTVEGKAQQRIGAADRILLNRIDLGRLPVADREESCRRHLSEERGRPFDLENGPLFRTALIRMDNDEHVLVVTMHHIISDGASLGILSREFTELYTAFHAGQPSPLDELPIQYVDFACWERDRFQGETLDAQAAYWKQQLEDLTTLTLPTDHTRPPIQTFRGARTSAPVSSAASARIKALSREVGATPYMILLAAFKVLLKCYCGQTDIVVGTPTAGREHRQLEGLIGFFVNTLVLRTDLAGDPTFRELLTRVKNVVLDGHVHQQLPFDKLVDLLQTDRDPSRNPLFQVSFAMQTLSERGTELPELSAKSEPLGNDTTRFDLELHVVEVGGRHHVSCVYAKDLFEGGTVDRVLRHFQTLLERLLDDPDAHLSKVDCLGEDERRDLLYARNTTECDYPRHRCVHDLFQGCAAKYPERTAVVDDRESLTYGQLNRRANQLSVHLQSLGVGPDCPVGILLDRGSLLILAQLGVLKAGGAYVPLDSQYPEDRLAFMLEDAGASALLTCEALKARVPADPTRTTICLDADWPAIGKLPAEDPRPRAAPQDLAYVIYTSGSTGRPKGVAIQHDGLMNLVTWHQRTYRVSPEDRATLVASPAFDASVWETWPYLAAGASLHVPGDQPRGEPAQLVPWLADQKITICFLPTPLAEAMLRDAQWPAGLALRVLLIGGDVLHAAPQEPLPFQLVNHYGPTESTVVATCCPVKHGTPGRPPIGRPIANTQVYLLDEHMNPVPPGAVGEICIGGASLARGYHGRPDLTAERFVVSPFDDTGAARLYRTGDTARYRADGEIEFLGRLDHQVKVRGYRIELGEIETVLRQHPSVAEAVVLAQADENDRQRLVAYVVCRDGDSEVDRFTGFLRDRLPEYMVPTAIVFLDSLPLTSRGKLDRDALPMPERSSRDFVAPRNEREQVLAEVWAAALGVERVGIHDNFFELGGDSILSIQIIARANSAGIGLTPQDLFQNQTIAELVRVATDKRIIEAEQGVVTGDLSLTPIQQWYFEQTPVDPHHFNQAMLLEVCESLNPDLMERAVAQMIVHHDALRLRFKKDDTGWRQFIVPPPDGVPFEHIDLSSHEPSERSGALQSAVRRLQSSLDIYDGPLIRVAHFAMGDGATDRLLIIVNHLAVDGVSWRIILEDLQTAYRQLREGVECRLPAKTTSLQQWVRRLTEYAESDDLRMERSYWDSLVGCPQVALPTDMPDGDAVNTVASSEKVSVSLSTAETQSLLQDVPKAYRTQVNDVLLTALARVFTQWSRMSSMLVALEAHGRESLFKDMDLSRTVGWFTSLCPVVLDLENKSRPGEALMAIKEQLRRVPNHGIGYGILRYLGRHESLAVLRPQVSFNYLGQFDRVVSESAMLRPAPESAGPTRSPRARRPHLIAVDCVVTGGSLKAHWVYSRKVHGRETIEKLAGDFVAALQELISHCQDPDAGGLAVSDFPLLDIEQSDLDAAIDEVEFE